MRVLRRRPPLTLILAIGLTALLPLIAFLQFRWLGEVSKAEQERMGESLKKDTASFGKEFDHEIARAYIAFSIEAGTSLEQRSQRYTQSYARWTSISPYPKLVKEVLDIEEGRSQIEISRFDPGSSKLQLCDWPAYLTSFRGLHDLVTKPITSSGPAAADEDGLQGPVLVVPHAVSVLPSTKGQSFAFELNKRMASAAYKLVAGYSVVVFDLDYIQREFIPLMAARNFSGANGLDYALTVLSRARTGNTGPGSVVYRSDPSQGGEDPSVGDASSPLFSIRLEDLQSSDGRLLPGIPGPPGSKIPVSTRIAISTVQTFGDRPPSGLVHLAGDPLWNVVLKHRAGSLDAGVARTRKRNLAVSFGVLLLLGASMALMLVLTHRARRLAQQQVEFVAGVSHEFRTPLAVICSAADNLADGVIGEPAQVKRYGKLVQGEGRRLTEMVEQVLQFAGVQSGRKAYSIREERLAEVVDRAIACCDLLIEEGKFVVEKNIPADLPMILTDSDALERSIQNLLSNAMKYGGPDRWIGVKAQVSAGGGEVELTVEDRGLGIAPADLPRIFEPFYRGREVIAAQIHGNGLGLSLVRHVSEACGGRVSVKTWLGHGSAFTVHLRAASPSPRVALEHIENVVDA